MNAPVIETTGSLALRPMLINGAWVAAQSGDTLAVENPATRQPIANVPRGRAADVEAAVAAAHGAFPAWSRVPPRDRGRILLRIADALDSRAEEIGRQIAQETGNALRTQARPEAQGLAQFFRYFGGLAGEAKGTVIPLNEDLLSYTRREPIGVVGAIIPWNAPASLAALKIAPALSVGNTVVLKAAEDAPLCVLMLARICQEHLPPGVLNVVTGTGPEAGEPLARHPLVRKISFTGSTAIGKLIMGWAAERVVPVSLELGGKSPCMVYPDVGDEDWIIDGIVSAMRFTRQSQSCTAGSRLFLHRRVFDSVLARLSARLSTLRLGDPLDEATDMGAIINARQFAKVCGYVEEGLARDAARLVVGGLPPKEGPLAQGYFAVPTVFADTSNDWRLAREEIFGPVLVAIPWEDEAEMLRMANDTHYGLAAYVFTRDIGTALRVAHAVEAGWVQVNQGGGQMPGQSYGGFKQSGIGREWSLEGMLDSFTQVKNITVNLNLPPRAP
jgi:betaine-aldehyde dehydrogenase